MARFSLVRTDSPKHTPQCAEHQEDSLALYYVQHDVLFGSISSRLCGVSLAWARSS